MKHRRVTRWAIVLDGCDVDGGFITAEEARRQIPALAESHGWDREAMTVDPREDEVMRSDNR